MSCEGINLAGNQAAKDAHDDTKTKNRIDAFAMVTARGNGGEFAPPPHRPLTHSDPKVGEVEALIDKIIPPSLRVLPKARPK